MADDRKFKFISPGVFIDEIDNSQIPNADPAGAVGPVIIGTAPRGPAMVPTTVTSFSDLIEKFGAPTAGDTPSDAWRSAGHQAPTYGLYAAQAWLRNNAPVTYVRLIGEEDPARQAVTGTAGFRAGVLNANPKSGGAFALVAWPSGNLNKFTEALGTPTNPGVQLSGAVAAVVYCDSGRVYLSGNVAKAGNLANSPHTGSDCVLFETDTTGHFTIGFDATGAGVATEQYKAVVSLNPDDRNFIRKVLNTNPALVNSDISTAGAQSASHGGKYWLGESYERQLTKATSGSMGVLNANMLGTQHFVAMFPMRNQGDTSQVQNNRLYSARKGTTGWFIAQDLNVGTNRAFQAQLQQKLFRIESLTAGEDVQRRVKVSIEKIMYPEGDFEEYGTFSLVLRAIDDTDKNQKILERFDGLNLNPASPSYIARVIGDKYVKYDSDQKTNREYGTYANQSRYVRVVMDGDVDRGTTNAEFLPWGVFGPATYRAISITSGSGFANPYGTYISGVAGIQSMLDGGDSGRFGGPGGYLISVISDHDDVGMLALSGAAAAGEYAQFSGNVVFPSVPLRRQADWSSPREMKEVYWGAWTGIKTTEQTFNPAILDHIVSRANELQAPDPEDIFGAAPTGSRDIAPQLTASAVDGWNAAMMLPSSASNNNYTSSPLQHAWVFTLDDVIVLDESFAPDANIRYGYLSGSRQNADGDAGTCFNLAQASGGYTGSIDKGIDRFTTCLHGGFNGFDVKEKNPFRNNSIASDATEVTSNKLHTLKRAVNIIKDADQVSYNLAAMPGVTNAGATDALLEVAEERGDALAIIDLDRVYTPATESTGSSADRNAFTVLQATEKLKNRNINNSFGAAYSPWVQIQDTISNRLAWVPPSVAALGALSNNDRVGAPWFAPAGFTRGGLSEGAGGIPVLDVSRRYNSDDRDKLYEQGINPIAKFPAEGIVIFGQKTLQQTASALDRINVRRLLIFLKREISFIASRLLFQSNTQTTWTSFLQQAEPVLDGVKAQFGIDDFRLILDETTTTPDLVDRNIIYSKLIVKPTRSAEFFAIDFVITNSGAAFDD